MTQYRGEEHRGEATATPVPGRYYIVGGIKKGEGLSHMAAAAYGNGRRWREIWKPNKQIARSSDPNRSFWPGDVIWIPGDAIEEEKREELRDAEEELPGAERLGMQLVIDGTEVAVSSGQVVVAFDTISDGWAVTVPWNPENESQRKLFAPYGYQSAEMYVGGKLQCRGLLYKVSPTFSEDGRSLRLEGWSLTADLIDTTIRPPYERNKVTLQARAAELVAGCGIEIDWRAGDDAVFDRVTANEGQAIFDHLAELAAQRGVQISSSAQGRLLFHKAEASAPVCSFVEASPPFTRGTASYDGRARFASYTARGQSPGKNKATATANDPAVPAHRILSFTADEQSGTDLQKAANWKRNKALGDSMTLEIPANSWYAPGGSLWEVGAMVTVVSPSLFLYEGFDFLIKQVTFDLEDAGATSKLTLVPPQVFNGEELPDPWYDSGEVTE